MKMCYPKQPCSVTVRQYSKGTQHLPNHLENVATLGVKDTYYVNEQVLLYLEAGQSLVLFVRTVIEMKDATVSGYIVNLGI